MRTKQREWLFLFACLLLGILANFSFLHGRIGVAYVIFIAAFYTLLFIRFRFQFEHRRIGLLLMAGIWILSGSYVFYDSEVFYLLNLIMIPAVVFFQIVLITSPKNLDWSKLSFVRLVTGKLSDAFTYLIQYLRYIGRVLLRNHKRRNSGPFRYILIGLLLALPLLLIVVPLLMSADILFRNFIERMFFFQMEMNIVEIGFRIIFILVAALFFFCVFQVLGRRTNREIGIKQYPNRKNWNGIIAATVLTILNTVYLLFIAVQFQYFFQDGLQDGFTYAEYARRGFFELLLVTLINGTVLLTFMKRVEDEGLGLKRLLQSLYTLLILTSGLLLLSAWQRLLLYQESYGYTIDRMLAQSFMIFLLIIFAYTLIRVWLENLPILHFYLISAFVFYTTLNAINIEGIIVDNNIERYEETGKIDIYYLNHLGAEGVKGLIHLYEQDPELPELEEILVQRKEQIRTEQESWQAYNFAREEAEQLLEELEL